jgi:hypothetical protein
MSPSKVLRITAEKTENDEHFTKEDAKENSGNLFC